MAKQLSRIRLLSSLADEKNLLNSSPPPDLSMKRDDTTPESSRPSNESAFLRDRE